jgi:aspartate/methionine/tyrosine aminotransferase
VKTVSDHSISAGDDLQQVIGFLQSYRAGVPDSQVVADLTFGNPHEPPLPELVAALRTHIEPLATDWFAYKLSEAEPRRIIAEGLRAELGLDFAPEDIAMTRGAYGAITLAFSILLDPGDECIIPVPGWFLYETSLSLVHGVTVKVPLRDDDFDLDVPAIEAAITARTRVVVVNTPHNPTGVIYSRQRLEELAAMLTRKSAEFGRPIFILSDEPYRRIRFDGVGFTSPAEVYPWTLIDYSFGKVLLAPGLRLGYLAICPDMPAAARATLRSTAEKTLLASGCAFPDSILQYAVKDLETVSIDVPAYQRKRDRLYDALTQWGYAMTRPAGTFYLWGQAPGGDALAFAAAMAKQGVYVMPGTLFERPGDFRISLTGTQAMIEAALPVFEAMADMNPG